MNHCKTCRFFEPYEFAVSKDDGFGDCKNINLSPIAEKTGARLDAVEVGEDFGCVHHDDKS